MYEPLVLITRPKIDADNIAEEINKLGAKTLIAPMLKIEFCSARAIDFSNCQGILFTSSNGARALSKGLEKNHFAYSLPVFAVGNTTGRVANECGFFDIKTAAGDVESLIKCVSKHSSPHHGKLIHIAGSNVAGDLVGKLGNLSFNVKTEILYSADQTSELNQETIEVINNGSLEYAIFFSPRTTKTFNNLISAAKYKRSMIKMEAICLSEAVAYEARALPWHRVTVSIKPTQDALLSILAERIAERREKNKRYE